MDVIRRIGGNAWFKRLWTIQELLLASSAVFQIGHTQCSTVSLYTYFIIAEALAQTNLAELSLFCIRSQVLEVLQPPSTKFKALYVNLWAAKRSAKDGHEEILAMILKLACLCEAADPRDRAYGMYGLLRALASNVADASLFYVNYTKPLAEIYEDTARALVCMSKSLWPLEIISRMPETETVSTSDLPSWVPDLRNPSAIDIDWKPTLFRNVKSDRKLNIPARSTLRQKLREWIKMILGLAFEEKPEMVLPDTKASGRLQISVRYLAEVTEVYGRMPSPGKDSPDGDALRTACLSEWAAVVLAGQDEYLESGDGLAALESLTPALNHIRQRHTPVEVEDPPPGSSRGGSCRRQDQPIGAYDGAALFRTACGLLGLCKGDVRPGNRVWQAVGGRYPFVLRRELVPPWRSVLSSWSVWPRERVYSLVGIADVCGLDAQAREVAARWQKDLIKVHFHDVTLV
jgi:hypothetical protein